MKKKWYNYFVVSEGTAAAAEAGQLEEPRHRVVDVVPDAESEAVFTTPVADPAAFNDIYQSAQIATPDHEYTVLKVSEMLQSEHLQSLPSDVKRKSILVALEAAGVRIAEIVEDAVARDRALDTYERVLQKHLEDLSASKAAENKRLETEINGLIRELRERIEENEKEVRAEQDQLTAWRTQKRQEEDRIAEAVGYFVTENQITVGSGPIVEKGDAPNVR